MRSFFYKIDYQTAYMIYSYYLTEKKVLYGSYLYPKCLSVDEFLLTKTYFCTWTRNAVINIKLPKKNSKQRNVLNFKYSHRMKTRWFLFYSFQQFFVCEIVCHFCVFSFFLTSGNNGNMGCHTYMRNYITDINQSSLSSWEVYFSYTRRPFTTHNALIVQYSFNCGSGHKHT